MRIILIIFGISLAIVLTIGFGVRYVSPPYETIAATFFTSLEKREYIDAYEMLSTQFQSTIPLKNFEDFIEHSDYKNYKQGSWFNIVVEKNKGTMEGIITLKSGKSIPLAFSFVAEQDSDSANMMPNFAKKLVGDLTIWKIDGIRHIN